MLNIKYRISVYLWKVGGFFQDAGGYRSLNIPPPPEGADLDPGRVKVSQAILRALKGSAWSLRPVCSVISYPKRASERASLVCDSSVCRPVGV